MVQQSSTNNSGSSALGERLQGRLIKPAGVINTQQLHGHYQETQKTAGRLIQRLALPEQVKFRYGAGVLQPIAMIQRLQRQRTESSVSSQRFSASGTKVPTTNRVNPVSSLAKKSDSQISSPLVKASQGGGENKSKSEGHRQVRINRQATISEVNSLANNPSHSVQMQVENDSQINPPVIQTQPETSSVSLSPSPATSGTFRVSRQATAITPIKTQGAIARQTAVDNSTVQLAIQGNSTVSRQPFSASGTLRATTNSSVQRSPAGSVTPKPRATVGKKTNGIEASEGQSTQIPDHEKIPLPLAITPIKTQGAIARQTAVDNSTVQLAIQGNSTVSRQPFSASGTLVPTTNSTVVSTPTQLSDSSELNMIWRKNINGIEASERQSTPTPYSQKIPLPLAITPIKTQGAIARQTAVDNSTVQLATQGNSTVSSQPFSASGTLRATTNSSIDIPAIAEQVSRILARQLVVERERRGIGKWH